MTSYLRLSSHRLDDTTRDLLGKELADALPAARLDPDADEAILAGVGAHALGRQLSGDVLHALGTFADSGHHALLIRNLPALSFPATPVSGFADEGGLAAVNALHLGLIQLLGAVPFAVGYENNGRLIRNVVPNPEAAGTTSSWGADSEFSWHTDNPHLPFGGRGLDPRPYVPRYLAFYAARNEEQVPTEIAAVDDVVARLSAGTRQVLGSAQFSVGAPASNDAASAGRCQLDWVPLLESGGHGDWARFDKGTTVAVTESARAALAEWNAALEQVPEKALMLGRDDFLIFDNYRVVHRRRAFTPAPAERARWLRRCYAS